MSKVLNFALVVLGMLYIVYGVIAIYNWIVETFPTQLYSVETLYGLNIPADIGYSISQITVGMLFLASVYYNIVNIKGLSCALVGSFIGVVLLVLQLLVVLANITDFQLLSLIERNAEYNIVNDILRSDVLLGMYSLFILLYMVKSMRSYVKISNINI